MKALYVKLRLPHDDAGAFCARMLRELAARLERHKGASMYYVLTDAQGACGHAGIEETNAPSREHPRDPFERQGGPK